MRHQYNYKIILKYNIGLRLSNKMQSNNQPILTQLAHLFTSMFDKQQLRKNVYLFNAINQQMTLSVRTIQKEKRVAAITNDVQLILTALRNCPLVEVLSDTTIRLLMKGDQTIVKLKSSEGKIIQKKQLNNLTRQMRCEVKEEKNEWILQFQSHAAAVEFIERVKTQQKGYIFQQLQNHPYECLSKSIGNLRKQKKTQKVMHSQDLYNLNYYHQYYHNYFPQYEPFVRKAVDSDDDDTFQQITNKSTQTEKKEVKKQLSQHDFPSFEDMRKVIQETK